MKAFAGARGFSFVFRKELLDILPPMWCDRVVGGEDTECRRTIDQKGLIRLCTYHKTTDHIGNVLDDYWVSEANRFGIDVAGLTANQIAQMTEDRWDWIIKRRHVKTLISLP